MTGFAIASALKPALALVVAGLVLAGCHLYYQPHPPPHARAYGYSKKFPPGPPAHSRARFRGYY